MLDVLVGGVSVTVPLAATVPENPLPADSEAVQDVGLPVALHVSVGLVPLVTVLLDKDKVMVAGTEVG